LKEHADDLAALIETTGERIVYVAGSIWRAVDEPTWRPERLSDVLKIERCHNHPRPGLGR
jgi:hypothetical protein